MTLNFFNPILNWSNNRRRIFFNLWRCWTKSFN